jgi:hypothetical protein
MGPAGPTKKWSYQKMSSWLGRQTRLVPISRQVFTLTGENTLGPYRQCSDGRESRWAEKLAGALPIRRVLVSRFLGLWVLNG